MIIPITTCDKMSKGSMILRILIVVLGAAIISMFAYEIIQDQSSTSEVIELEILFVIVGKEYSKLNAVLAVSLQNLDEYLNSSTKENSEWILYCYSMDSVYKMHSSDKKTTKWNNGEVIQVESKRRKDSYRGGIKSAVKESFSSMILGYFSFFTEVIK